MHAWERSPKTKPGQAMQTWTQEYKTYIRCDVLIFLIVTAQRGAGAGDVRVGSVRRPLAPLGVQVLLLGGAADPTAVLTCTRRQGAIHKRCSLVILENPPTQKRAWTVCKHCQCAIGLLFGDALSLNTMQKPSYVLSCETPTWYTVVLASAQCAGNKCRQRPWGVQVRDSQDRPVHACPQNVVRAVKAAPPAHDFKYGRLHHQR